MCVLDAAFCQRFRSSFDCSSSAHGFTWNVDGTTKSSGVGTSALRSAKSSDSKVVKMFSSSVVKRDSAVLLGTEGSVHDEEDEEDENEDDHKDDDELADAEGTEEGMT